MSDEPLSNTSAKALHPGEHYIPHCPVNLHENWLRIRNWRLWEEQERNPTITYFQYYRKLELERQ